MASWLIPCSPVVYDAESAFQEYGHVVWHQDCNVAVGDTVYIYVTAPVKSIRCRCVITDADMPADPGGDDGYVLDEAFCARNHRRYMDLKLQETYDTHLLDYRMLLMNGLTAPIRSQRRVPPKLAQYLAQWTTNHA